MVDDEEYRTVEHHIAWITINDGEHDSIKLKRDIDALNQRSRILL